MILGGVVSLFLTIFTAWRTLDLLAMILPANQSAAAFFGVSAFDGGLIAWTILFLRAKSSTQRGIAGTVAAIDFLAVGSTTVMDLIATGQNKGVFVYSHDLYIWAIVIVAAVIMVNVGGGLLYAMADPKTARESRDQRAHNKINDLADQQIEAHAEMYAPQFAAIKVQQWLAQAQMLHNVQLPSLPPAQAPASLPQPQAQQPGLFGRIVNAVTGQQSAQPAKEVTGSLAAMPKDSTGVPSDEEIEQTLQRFHAYREAREAARKQQPPAFVPPSTLDYRPPNGDWNQVLPEAGTDKPEDIKRYEQMYKAFQETGRSGFENFRQWMKDVEAANANVPLSQNGNGHQQ
jgi:hypothetical protein